MASCDASLGGGTTYALQTPPVHSPGRQSDALRRRTVVAEAVRLGRKADTQRDVAAVGPGAARQAVSVRGQSASLSDVQQIVPAPRSAQGFLCVCLCPITGVPLVFRVGLGAAPDVACYNMSRK